MITDALNAVGVQQLLAAAAAASNNPGMFWLEIAQFDNFFSPYMSYTVNK